MKNVKNMWLHHYQSLLNSIPGSLVNIKKINEYYDSVNNEHFKYANEKLYVLMSLLYSMLIHVFLPDAMMITIIAPIIKNKAGDLSDNNNYRPFALATIASKLFESLILSRVSTFFIYMCKPIWI